MATALAECFVKNSICQSKNIYASDSQPDAIKKFTEKTHANTAPDNSVLVASVDVVICAVKPQHMAEALRNLRGDLSRKIFISIAAGLTLRRLSTLNSSINRWVRVMPNTPALIGEGASVYCLADPNDQEADMITKRLFTAAGICLSLPEQYFDVVTALSGSGPAYVYLFIEALTDAAVQGGLPRAEALQLAAQTVTGAAKMVLSSHTHPAVLRDQVTSPGGTTIHGLLALHEHGFPRAVHSAVVAAKIRSEELSQL